MINDNTAIQLEEHLKEQFGYKIVWIIPDFPVAYQIHCTRDCVDWVVVKAFEFTKLKDILEHFQMELWDYTYTLGLTILAIGKLFDIYGLLDMGYFFIADKFYFIKAGDDKPQYIFDVADVKQYTVSLNDNGDFEAIHVLTNEHFYVIAEDGFTEISYFVEIAKQLGIERENVVAFAKAIVDLGVALNLTCDAKATIEDEIGKMAMQLTNVNAQAYYLANTKSVGIVCTT